MTRRLTVWLIGTIAGLLLGLVGLPALDAVTLASSAELFHGYAFDGSPSSSLTVATVSERGPPATHTHTIATYDSQDRERRSRRALGFRPQRVGNPRSLVGISICV